MNLTLYRINDDKNVINKTLGDGVTIPIMLKSDVNIVQPTLVLSDLEMYNFNNFNYCFIDVLNRYYFIDSVTSINNRLWKLECTCDVLETYKADALSAKGIYKIEAKAGDYGTIEASSNLNVISNVSSNKALEFDKSIIITTVEL